MSRVGWITVALLAGAVKIFAHPLGQGLFGINGTDIQIGRVESGDYPTGAVPIHGHEILSSGASFGEDLSLPLGKAFGLIGTVEQFGSTLDRSLDEGGAYSGHYHSSQTTDGQSWGLSTRVWLSEFFEEPFVEGQPGNPDGPRFWPQLTLRGAWENDNTVTKLSAASGLYAGNLPGFPQHVETFSAFYGFIIPLNRYLSIDGSYGEAYSRYEMIGPQVDVGAGQSDFLTVGASFFFKWNPFAGKGEEGDYFPLLGRPGHARLDVYYNNQYVRSSGSNPAQISGANLRLPITPLVAAGLGYELSTTDQGFFDTTSNFSPSESNPTIYRIKGSLTMSLGALLR
jgi:hypothetical protein